MQNESISLHCTEGGSDKVYLISLEGTGESWSVNFSFGRRGGPLKAGTKTPNPVNHGSAKAIYDKLVGEKVKKGYRADADAAPSVLSPIIAGTEARDTGIRPQLLNPIDDSELEALLRDDDFVVQTKHDGERRMIIVEDREVRATQRAGLLVPVSQSIVAAFGPIVREGWGRTVIDGEDMGAGFVAFDLLELDGRDLRGQGFTARHTKLDALLSTTRIDVSPVYVGEAAKRAHLARVSAVGGEGVVFKRGDAPYVPGRPASRGTQLKWKLVAEATLVAAPNTRSGKRSIALLAARGDERVEVGNVTVPANLPIPAAGALVEVRYLYRVGANGSLFQPVLKSIRSDKSEPDDVSTLKLKACAA